MKVLIIDTATRIGSVATMNGDQLLCSLQSEVQSRHAERLLELVASALEQSGWTLKDLELIAAGMGPGSFTGVRVGMATAKGLALATATPIVGVVSLQAMAHSVHQVRGPVPVVAMLDAKKGEVFLGAYGPSGESWTHPTHLPRSQARTWLSSLPTHESDPWVVCGEVAWELELDPFEVLQLPSAALPTPQAIGSLAQESWGHHPISQLELLEPLYVRPPDIHLPHGRQ